MDLNQIFSLEAGYIPTHPVNSVISNLASVMSQQVSYSAHESDTNDGSSTLGGCSDSTTNTLNLLRDSSDFPKGRSI